MRTRAWAAGAAMTCALLLSACGAGGDGPSGSNGGQAPQGQQQNGQLEGGAPAPDLPEGWLDKVRQYADCLRKNGVPNAEVDEARGGLKLDTQVTPEAANACRQYNPVGQDGAQPMTP
ncbi:hypothetical protein ACIRPX_39245 [Streptomyces sp. NPDC101225]|uniref:hypothetical protein n=1 Tax=Streptomyces sp. NPDC101225 TaxID=3366135 RepID=UPI0037F55616